MIRRLELAALLALLTFCAACELTTPPECVALCEQIQRWSEQCNGPKLSTTACMEKYACRADNHYRQREKSVDCWNKLVQWTPNLKAELDCSKPPPGL